MRKLMLSLVFVLGTMTMVNAKTNDEFKNSKENIESSLDGSMKLTLSCGVSGTLSWTGNPSFTDILNQIDRLEARYCPQQ